MMTDPHIVVLFHHFRSFLERVAARGIDAAPLKGAHLLTSVYPPNEDRGPMADVDFLVRPEQWDDALEILREMGFVQRPLPGREATRRELYEAPFVLNVSQNAQILFEPHRYLVQPARLPADYDALWARASASTFEGAPCKRLCTEDHLLHAAIHLSTHFFNLPSTWMRDVSLLIESGPPDWGAIARRADEWRIRRVLWLTAVLHREGTGLDTLAPLIDRLSISAPVRKLLRYLVPNIRGFRRPDLPLRVREALLWPALLDSPRDAVRFATYYARLRSRDFLTSLNRPQ